jgi:hypothetical protein
VENEKEAIKSKGKSYIFATSNNKRETMREKEV